MKNYFSLIAVFILVSSIPSPNLKAQTTDSTFKEPAWLFPIWFKNAFGEVDTVWFGHDNLASFNIDTLFNERMVSIDTSKFAASLECYDPFSFDSCYKTLINNFNIGLNSHFYIFFHKGYKPLTMYWDKTLFYSDSLPYPDLSPQPRARGDLYCNDGDPLYNNCPTNFPIVMTDNPDSLPVFMPFTQSDSIYFDGPGDGLEEQGDLLLYIYPYDFYVGIGEQKDDSKSMKLYPNPSNNTITIELENYFDFNYSIYSILGEAIITGKKTDTNKTEINIEHLPQGIYYLRTFTKNEIITKNFIKE